MFQQQLCSSNAICQIDLMGINGGSMPVHIPHRNSLALTMWQEALYTDDDCDDDAKAWLHVLSCPLVQISQKHSLVMESTSK